MAKILIVDDSEFIRTLLKEILIKICLSEYEEASDGFEAVQLARKTNYDMIFMDIMMPKMEGLEATRQILTFNPQAKIVICTSIEQDKIRQDSLSAGAKDLITKPFNAETVKVIIKKYAPQLDRQQL